jgi:cytochrome c peroxidase
MPQIGPGKGDGIDGHDDFGRERVSGDDADRYKFRTPSLRQVAYTGPWGHDGAYDTLQAVIRHHLDPISSLNNYDADQLHLPSRADLDAKDLIAHSDVDRRSAIAASNELSSVDLTDAEISDLMEFLNVGLTDASCVDIREDVPARVPSGLPLAD